MLPHTQVISQGCIKSHNYTFSRDGTISATVGLGITRDMVPRVKVLAWFVRDNGELVADLIELPVCCEIENKVCRQQVA